MVTKYFQGPVPRGIMGCLTRVMVQGLSGHWPRKQRTSMEVTVTMAEKHWTSHTLDVNPGRSDDPLPSSTFSTHPVVLPLARCVYRTMAEEPTWAIALLQIGAWKV